VHTHRVNLYSHYTPPPGRAFQGLWDAGVPPGGGGQRAFHGWIKNRAGDVSTYRAFHGAALSCE